MKILVVKAVLWTIVLFYGFLTCLRIIYQWFRKGNQFWTVKDRSLAPKILQDKQYGKHSSLLLKDVKIHYVENGDRNKPLMLLVHGFPEFWFSWRHQLKAFAATHWVVAIDMRGYGDSSKPTEKSAYKMDLLEKDIVDIVKGLKKEKCILVGHDWGGAIVWNVASKYPQIIEKLIVLNAPNSEAMKKLLKTSLKQFFKSWYIFMFQLPYLPETFFYTEDLACFKRMFCNFDKSASVNAQELEAFKYTFGKKDSWTYPINYYRNAVKAEGFLGTSEEFKRIKVPTLVIWGEDDLALEKSLAELSGEFVDDFRVHYIPQGNHFIQQDKPFEVNEAIKKFLVEKN